MFNNITVRTRLLTGFLLVALLGGLVAAIGIVNMSKMNAQAERAYASDLLGISAVKEANIQALEDEKAKLQAELQQLRTSGTGSGPNSSEAKARARLERQKALATKEVEFLRAQVKAFDDEEREILKELVAAGGPQSESES